MRVVEYVRHVLQDFLTPELCELKVRIEAVERQVYDLKGSMQGQFQHLEQRAQQRHKKLRASH
jgi:hypothetical protein